MKVSCSLKTLKKRTLTSFLVRRGKKLFVRDKKNRRFNAKQ